MDPRYTRRVQAGWSLVEMAVVLVVLALVGILAVRLGDLGGSVAREQDRDAQLADADAALIGFLLAHQRLPAADDAARDGLEDPGNRSGWLPVRTLGLPADLRVRYAVSASLSSAPAADRFSPLLPDAPDDTDGHAAALTGLDTCMVLKALQTGSGSAELDGVPVAYALTDTGGAGDDFTPDIVAALPGSEDAVGQRTLAVGPGELAVRISCLDRVVRTTAAARSAYAASDMVAFAELFRDIRAVAYQSNQTSVEMAALSLTMASMNFALGLYQTSADSFTMAEGWPVPVGLPVAIVSMIATAGAMATASYDLASASADMAEAPEERDDAQRQLAAADAYLLEAETRAEAAYARASALDAGGLDP
ncbi:hypothetical protein [Coralloluteibacterium stylophorae]|uniref:Prepilin-type N-terminal cleavage/methylation domain-containing protein n=1 Tax=Coralloluteibacterium stylophorae TaxID=1776034 RepID=A0AAP2CC35_9GAMM|nr:hypothetical protein [Coralloluteibacterium stylophorae]MBS7456802.1 hypothetical protein [Coralloluteibacterium stylophorae]